MIFEATQQIVIESQIAEWEVKEHLKLHLLHIYYIMIQCQLKDLNAAKDLSFQKCGTIQKTTGSVRDSF
jgi:hypothetical protein